jgi:O-antigen/teichoic acid export membrane protein
MGLGMVLAFAAPLNVGVIQGRQQFKWFAFLNICVALLRVVSTTVVLLLGFGMTGVLLASLINGVVIYALSFVPLRDVLRAPQARVPSFKPLLTYSFGAVLTIGGSTLLLNTDTILAKHFLSSTDAGYYAALTKMGQSVLFVGGSMVLVMFPKVAALQQQGRPHRGVLVWTMAGVFALSACVLFFFWLFPSQIITLIFHAPAVVSRQLFWYGLAMLLLALANVLMYYFLSLGQMAFVPILLICCGLQAALIMVWHASIAQIVAVMVAVMATLLCGVAALCAVQLARDSRRGVCEQPA